MTTAVVVSTGCSQMERWGKRDINGTPAENAMLVVAVDEGTDKDEKFLRPDDHYKLSPVVCEITQVGQDELVFTDAEPVNSSYPRVFVFSDLMPGRYYVSRIEYKYSLKGYSDNTDEVEQWGRNLSREHHPELSVDLTPGQLAFVGTISVEFGEVSVSGDHEARALLAVYSEDKSSAWAPVIRSRLEELDVPLPPLR
jgi:hypothetical protein